MTKRQLIDEIVTMNRTAEPGFLAQFDDEKLLDYLLHLRVVRTPRLGGDPRRYDRYFKAAAVVAARDEGVESADDVEASDADIDGTLRRPAWPGADDAETLGNQSELEEARTAVVAAAAAGSGDEQVPVTESEESLESWLF